MHSIGIGSESHRRDWQGNTRNRRGAMSLNHPRPPLPLPLSLPRPLRSPSAVLSSAGQVSDRGPSGEASEEDYEAVGRVLRGEGDAGPGQPRSMWQLALERERVGPSR